MRNGMFVFVGLLLAVCNSFAADMDASRYLGDNRRTGYVDATIDAKPVLQWTYAEKHAPRHAWREPNREIQFIDFDYATQVAISDGMVFFGSSADHKVYAVDLASGREKWTFYTEGPVRFAPVVYRGRVYAASDDGYLYCLEAKSGSVLWKFRGGPSDEKLIGNEQMISHWPARSGAMIEGDKLFFTAGMWSRDGVFIYCLDPEDGSVVWKNDTSGFHFATLPHHAGFAGVAPQGYLVHHRSRLYVPTGRGAPACFDAVTGEFIFYENGHGYKPHQPGGSWVMAWRDWVIFKRRAQHSEESVRYEERDLAGGAASGLYALDFRTGEPKWSLTDRNVALARKDFLVLGGAESVIKVDMTEVLEGYKKYSKDGKMIAYDDNIPPTGVEYSKSGEGHLVPHPPWMSPLPFKKWEAKVGRVFTMVQGGETILAGGRGRVSAIDFGSGRVLWHKRIEGDARGICVANGNFIVSSTSGKLYCFGKGVSDSTRTITPRITKPFIDNDAKALAERIVRTSGIDVGYALMLGAGDGRLLCALAQASDLAIYCVEPDAAKAGRVRKVLDDAGLLGVRATVHAGSFGKLAYNPYFANLVVWGDQLGSGVGKVKAAELYRVLRPYGGVAIQLSADDGQTATRKWLSSGGVPGGEISSGATGLIVTRGELAGAGQWTHAQANVGRTGASAEKLAKLPLGMLWWGGPGPARMVSRHWRSPVPLFCNGIMYIQGQHDIIAVDAYNGHEMWNRHLEGVGRFPPSKRGGNIVADADSVYCVQGTTCLRLDGRTGKTLREYEFVLDKNHEQHIRELLANYANTPQKSRIVWEYLGLSGKYIIGSLANEEVEELGKTPAIVAGMPQQARYVFVFDKTTGRLLWEHRIERAVSPMAMVADERRLYLLDRTDERLYQQDIRRGIEDFGSVLTSLDLGTGKVVWEKAGVEITNKSLLLKNDSIVAYPNPSEQRDPVKDGGVAVYDASDGRMLWEIEKLKGVSDDRRGGALHHMFAIGDTLYVPWAYDLRTGKERLTKTNPLTGAAERFDVPGKNFCGTIAAGENILMYRSASVGFAPVSEDSGSYWLPEVRPSCWISVIPAGGIVLAPAGYSTCICPYNYKTSVALMPVERNEDWSVYLSKPLKKWPGKKGGAEQAVKIAHIKSLRVNLNAAGDHMDSNGQLWLAYPRPTGGSKRYSDITLPVELKGADNRFRYNSDYDTVSGTDEPWLFGSGIVGAANMSVQLSDGEAHTYTVRLHFAEPEDTKPGERVFDVKVQGKRVLSGIDIAKETGGKRRALVKEIKSVAAKGTMSIELAGVKGKGPLLCSVEIVEKGH